MKFSVVLLLFFLYLVTDGHRVKRQNGRLLTNLLFSGRPVAKLGSGQTNVGLYNPGNVEVGHGKQWTVLETGLKKGWDAGGGVSGGGFQGGKSIPVLGLGDVFSSQKQGKVDIDSGGKAFFGKNIGAGPFPSVYQKGYTFGGVQASPYYHNPWAVGG